MSRLQYLHSVFLGIGSNMGHPIHSIKRAIDVIENRRDTRITKKSSYYRSDPLGGIAQPDFINAVIKLETSLSPMDLLKELQKIEALLGRESLENRLRWGPRVIDLDILLYNNLFIESPVLSIPHPGLRTRAFVLGPLFEIEKELTFGRGERLEDWVNRCDLKTIQKLGALTEV